MKLEEITSALKKAFERDDVKKAVLGGCWYDLNMLTGIDSTGFCHAATEVIFRLNGGKDKWKVRSIKFSENWSYGTHYFLRYKSNNKEFDISRNQFEERNIIMRYDLSIVSNLRNTSNEARVLARMAGLGELPK